MMGNNRDEIHNLQERIEQLEAQNKELLKNATSYTQIRYLLQELAHHIDVEAFVTKLLENIKSLTGGIPSLAIQTKDSFWEVFNLDKQRINEPWYPLSKNESGFYDKIADIGQITFASNKDDLNDYPDSISSFIKENMIKNLVAFAVQKTPATVIEVRDVSMPVYLTRYTEEIREFLLPLNLSINQAMLLESNMRSTRRSNFLLDLLFHDIRNFITTTRGSLGLIEDFSGNEELKMKSLEIAKRQMANAQELLNRVQKILVKGNSSDLYAFNLREIIEDSKHVVLLQFSNENPVIEISEQFKSVDSFVLGDELIIEIFVNLMTNAIKYTDLEIKRVDVSWEPWVRNRDFSHVKVTDHGIGIPDDQKSHLFGRFSKIESTKGLGLGLNIVLGLVERYGGYIWFENRIPGDYKQGTVANVCLRRANQ